MPGTATTSPSIAELVANGFLRVPDFTYANRPDPTKYPVGEVIRLSDVGIADRGLYVRNTGTLWTVAWPQTYARRSTGAVNTGNTNENIMDTIALRGGLLGLNGSFRMLGTELSMTNNANIKSLILRLGGTLIYQNDMVSMLTAAPSLRTRNRGSLSAQITNSPLNTAAHVTTAVDTSLDQNITICLKNAVGGDSITLEAYAMELLP